MPDKGTVAYVPVGNNCMVRGVHGDRGNVDRQGLRLCRARGPFLGKQNRNRDLKAEQEGGHCRVGTLWPILRFGWQVRDSLVANSPLVTLPYCDLIWFTRSEHYIADFLKLGSSAKPYPVEVVGLTRYPSGSTPVGAVSDTG